MFKFGMHFAAQVDATLLLTHFEIYESDQLKTTWQGPFSYGTFQNSIVWREKKAYKPSFSDHQPGSSMKADIPMKICTKFRVINKSSCIVYKNLR